LLYNLALLSSYLEPFQESEYSMRLEDLYDKMRKSLPETQKFLESKRAKDEAELRRKRTRLGPDRRLTFFISPYASLRELRRDMKFVKGLGHPEINVVGRFRYSLEAELTSITLRAYTSGDIDLARIDNLGEASITYRETDLVQFSLQGTPFDIAARSNGVVIAHFPLNRPEEFQGELARTLMFRLNEIFS